jgi:WS/DGAT/MGAT family acyltransferase
MRQLSGLDAGFLYLESRTNYGHVTGLAVMERPSDDYQPFERVLARWAALVGHVAPLRRRLVEVPFDLDLPYWIDDPDFDLAYHVRHLGLAPPGTMEQLGDQIARIASRPMDRTRPLWESYVIEGLPAGRWALLTKTHHSAIDGAAGVLMLHTLADTEPDPSDPLQPVAWAPEQVPSELDLLLRTLRHAATNPIKAVQIQARLVREVSANVGMAGLGSAAIGIADALLALGRSRDEDEHGQGVHHQDPLRLPLTSAPPTPWNRSISAQRRFAMGSVALDEIKALKNTLGGTVNDVIMAICAGALRQYLLEHDALPSRPLRAMVPVSIRTFDEDEPWTNRVSAIVVELPTDLDDPLERLERSRENMDAAKRSYESVPASTLIEASRLAPGFVAATAIRLASKLADRITSPVNLVISNVPGPREPLFLAGAEMMSYVPVSVITDGLGLNITVHSYLDRVDFGLLGDRELVPDLWHLVDLHVEQLRLLVEQAGLAPLAEPPRQ